MECSLMAGGLKAARTSLSTLAPLLAPRSEQTTDRAAVGGTACLTLPSWAQQVPGCGPDSMDSERSSISPALTVAQLGGSGRSGPSPRPGALCSRMSGLGANLPRYSLQGQAGV